MTYPLLFNFIAGSSGAWAIESIAPVCGASLAMAPRLAVIEGDPPADPGIWSLRGTTSNTRYANRQEIDALVARQEGLARPQATRAALIPIRKSEAWWALAQDERRQILEEQSRHIAIGLEYLPAIARRLHHCRDIGEPFDFLTWFEYAPQDSRDFEILVQRLRDSPEWAYVDREVDIRLSRAS